MATFDQAAAALRSTASALPAATKKATRAATELMASAVLVGQAGAGAGSGRLRGVGQNGGPIGVFSSVRNNTGLVAARGAAWLLDHPSRAHAIRPRRRRALRTPEGARASAIRPAIPGKPYFETAVAETAPKIPALYAAAVGETIQKGLG